MLYRDQFIYNIPNVPEHRKHQMIAHMNNMMTKSLLFRLVEIFEVALHNDTPLKVKTMAAGFSGILHQYYVFDLDKDDFFAETMKLAQAHYAPDHVIWDIYEQDRKYWSVHYLGQWYADMDLDDYQRFEQIGLKHRSYAFILYETLKPYIRTDVQQPLLDALTCLMNGITYFYDVVMYTGIREQDLRLEYSKFSEFRTLKIMRDAEYDVSNIDYKTLQNYVLATGEYEHFLGKAKAYYQQSYDLFFDIPKILGQRQRAGRLRVITGVIRYCDLLLREAEDMFSKTA